MATLTEAELQAIISSIDTAITTLVTGKVKEYRIGKRWFVYYDLRELRELRAHYREVMSAIPTEEATVFDDPDV
jgi:hypothetical protein